MPAAPPSAAPEFFSRQIAEARRFHLEPKPPRGTRLAVVSGGREHCAPDYEIHRETFPFLALEFVAGGRGSLRLAGKSHPLKAGSIFAYGPGIPHDIVSDPAAPLVKYFVDFTGSGARALLGNGAPQPGELAQTMAPAEVIGIFDALIRDGGKSTRLCARIAAAHLELLLLKIAESAIPPGLSGSPALATYRRCLHFIGENWNDVDTLGQLAAACHIDPAYLCRLFRKFHQPSPYQLLLHRKITAAAERLLLPGASVKSIAAELRFSDAFHFSRVFKKHMGLPPSAYVRLAMR
jgi:AraC-like DNA-binding protein